MQFEKRDLFGLPRESSLLHLDLVWYTGSRDTQVKAKLQAIRKAINAALPHNVEILEEELSRRIPTGKWKNSFHLYAMVTLSHNAGGCMRPLVTEKIWGSLKDRRDMYCGLDLGIYTRNRNFKIPGSSKYAGFYQYPFPSRAFFMATRMADRLKPPDLSTEQLNLKGLMTFRSSHSHSEGKKATRKRRLAIA